MKAPKLILSLLLGFYFISFFGCQEKECKHSFNEFITNIDKYDKLKILFEKQAYQDVILGAKDIHQDIYFRVPASYYIASSFYAIGELDSAIHWFGDGFSNGYELDFLNGRREELDTIWNSLQELHTEKRRLHTQSIDTTLRKEIIQMIRVDQKYRRLNRSLQETHEKDSVKALMRRSDRRNIDRLNDIVQQYDWPGKALIGGHNSNFSGAGLLVVHGQEKDYYDFLPFMIEAAQCNLDTWSDVNFISQNLCWRFQDSLNRVKLRGISVKNNNTIDVEKSYIQIYGLASFLNKVRFPWSPREGLGSSKVTGGTSYREVRFFIRAKPNEKHQEIKSQYSTALNQLRDTLNKRFLVPANMLSIDEHVHVIEEDGLGDFRFGYTLIQ
ncbi:MAG: hypothetical protein AB8F95_00430 [Bacteroidia bacterium]